MHIVIDLIHVLEYLCSAAWCLHDPAAEAWVARHTRTILGGAEQFAAALHTAARAPG
ncbi:hypothetical protein OHS33_00165 [Streptomyces sp. NBC_00536]|uniref:hypothetical protein n=1 Tax=Streptomyces sp. NBC_00536 TaxID=2975769 RepID=UPI002E817A6D|nr:hypothetical protein [Streptomyces sp. NBC_00536]WUC76900.1 hypothetical protein OHS33_00165 [Streptomyces sp. NBC_00536]